MPVKRAHRDLTAALDRILRTIGYILPAEAAVNYYREVENQVVAAA